MEPQNIAAFNDSLARCLASEDFLDRFYELFLASSPAVETLFKETDFARQKRMLRSSLYMMIMVVEGEDEARSYLERVAERHGSGDLAVPSEMYDLWLDSLLRAARERDPEWSEQVEGLWRQMMAEGIAFMRAHARGRPGTIAPP